MKDIKAQKVNDFVEGHTGSQSSEGFWTFYYQVQFSLCYTLLRGNVTNLLYMLLVIYISIPNNDNKITLVEIILVKTSVFYSGEIFHKLFSYYGKFKQELFQIFFFWE